MDGEGMGMEEVGGDCGVSKVFRARTGGFKIALKAYLEQLKREGRCP